MDDVRAVLEAVGSERAAALRLLRRRADVPPLRRHLSRADGCAHDDLAPSLARAGLPITRSAPTAENRRRVARGRRAQLGPPSPRRVEVSNGAKSRRRRADSCATRASTFGVPRARGSRRRCRAHELAHRCPGGAAHDPRADARRSTARAIYDVNVEEGRYLASRDPGREDSRTRGGRPLDLGRGHGMRSSTRLKNFSTGTRRGAGARPRPRDRAVHRHRRVDGADGRAGRPRVARPARRARRRVATRA